MRGKTRRKKKSCKTLTKFRKEKWESLGFAVLFLLVWEKTSLVCSLLEADRAAEVHWAFTEPGSSLGHVGFITAKSIVSRMNYTEHQGCRRWKTGGSYATSMEKYKPLRR